jgi:hypothetical protein
VSEESRAASLSAALADALRSAPELAGVPIVDGMSITVVSTADDARATVTDLDSRRAAVRPGRCHCGSEWFTLRGRPGDPPVAENGAVTLSSEGSVTGYCGEPRCAGCGRAWSR